MEWEQKMADCWISWNSFIFLLSSHLSLSLFLFLSFCLSFSLCWWTGWIDENLWRPIYSLLCKVRHASLFLTALRRVRRMSLYREWIWHLWKHSCTDSGSEGGSVHAEMNSSNRSALRENDDRKLLHTERIHLKWNIHIQRWIYISDSHFCF